MINAMETGPDGIVVGISRLALSAVYDRDDLSLGDAQQGEFTDNAMIWTRPALSSKMVSSKTS